MLYLNKAMDLNLFLTAYNSDIKNKFGSILEESISIT